MSQPCPPVPDGLSPMEYYNTPMGVPYAEGPDGVGQEQRRPAESLVEWVEVVGEVVEGVEVVGEVQRDHTQGQPQKEEGSHDERRGCRMSYRQSQRAA
jgi:hypothetical protein